MSKKIVLLALCSLLLAPCSAAEAQQPDKIRRIGFLAVNSPSADKHLDDAFKQSLRAFGGLKARTSPSNTDLSKERPIAFPDSPRSW